MRFRICVILLLAAPIARASDREATLFDHAAATLWWLSAQINVIEQQHGTFRSPYSGPNSLRDEREQAISRVETLYTGYRLTPSFEVLTDMESAGGRGISDALGLAGFTNLDVVRNPALGARPYVARLMAHGVIALVADEETNERSALNGFASLPRQRIEWRVGKFSTVDFFDVNSAGSDSHMQFENWTADNDGAFDYAADTRGYTMGGVAELHERRWALRAGVELMPVVANGLKLDRDLRRSRGQNVELEVRAATATTLRVLLYENLARMGDYRAALREANGSPPDIEAAREPGRKKYGVASGLEKQMTTRGRLFARAGWNDGRTESFAYTEVDRALELGADAYDGHRLRGGIALIDNAISRAHRDYLAAGGLGFLLGDGALRYDHERIVETYFTVRVLRGTYMSADVQRVWNPGYNSDRGPVVVFGLRLHVEL